MIPFQRNGGSFVISAQIPLPGRPPANATDISAFTADLLDAVSGAVILDDVALTFDSASQCWKSAAQNHSVLDGIDYVQTRFNPTSANTLIQTFTTPPRAVADVLKRLDEIEAVSLARSPIEVVNQISTIGVTLESPLIEVDNQTQPVEVSQETIETEVNAETNPVEVKECS